MRMWLIGIEMLRGELRKVLTRPQGPCPTLHSLPRPSQQRSVHIMPWHWRGVLAWTQGLCRCEAGAPLGRVWLGGEAPACAAPQGSGLLPRHWKKKKKIKASWRRAGLPRDGRLWRAAHHHRGRGWSQGCPSQGPPGVLEMEDKESPAQSRGQEPVPLTETPSVVSTKPVCDPLFWYPRTLPGPPNLLVPLVCPPHPRAPH